MEESLGAPGACAFAFAMMKHRKHKRSGEAKGQVVEEWVVKFKCSLCPADGWQVAEDGNATKRHLLRKPHLSVAIAAGQMSNHTSAEAVLASLAPEEGSKASSLTAAGRRANSKQGKAVKTKARAEAAHSAMTEAMVTAALAATAGPAGGGCQQLPQELLVQHYAVCSTLSSQRQRGQAHRTVVPSRPELG